MRTLFALCATLAPLLVAGLECPDGFVDLELGDNRCYTYSNDSENWMTAFTNCLTSADGKGNLLSLPHVDSYYPQYYEVRSRGQDFWTGLVNIGGQHSWADNTPYDLDLDQFIAEDAGDAIYGYMSGEDGLFRFADTDTERGYVCYVDMTPEPTPTVPSTTQPPCPANWEQYGDTCFLFSEDKEYWPSAGHACHGEDEDGELVTINDTGVLTFLLLSAPDRDTAYWTGLQNQNNTYIWEDGSSTENVTEVLGPYLDEWSEGNDCVALVAGDYPKALEHMNCPTKQNYICYKAAATEDLYAFKRFNFWL